MMSTTPTHSRSAWGAVALLLLAVFVLFGFWQRLVVRPRVLALPQNYVQQAAHWLQQEPPQAVRAVQRLQRGMDFYLPRDREPVDILARALAAQGKSDAARRVQAQWYFQQDLRAANGRATPDPALLRKHAQAYLAREPYAATACVAARDTLAAAWAFFVRGLAAPLQAGLKQQPLTPAQQLALLELAGWRVQTGGRVGQTGARVPRPLAAASAGYEAWRGALLVVDGERVPLHRWTKWRGWSVAWLDPETLQVEGVKTVDLYARPAGTPELLAALQGVPAGRVVVALVADEGSRHLQQHAWFAALGRCGVQVLVEDLRGTLYLDYREPFAAVGVKGAAPGTALHVHGSPGSWPLGIVVLP